MLVSIIGLGYIGLPTAAILASRKIKVIGVDINQKAVDIINQGSIHIVEPGLEDIVKRAVEDGFLSAVTSPVPADVFIIAVPTPTYATEADMSYVHAAAKSIAPVLKKGDLVILESTSPVGSTDAISQIMKKLRPDLSFPQDNGSPDVHVAYCPERVLPGKVIQELVSNDRIIGGLTPSCAEAAKSLYRTFVDGALLETSARTAEMSKLTENAFRDVNIAFANELSMICEKLGIDVWELIKMANRHPRVNILSPGAGVGGHCIAVDPWFIVHSAPEQSKLIRTAREVNDSKPDWVIHRVEEAIQSFPLGTRPSVAFFGLAFKPNIDDLRESPALAIVNRLANTYYGEMMAVEPNIEHTHLLSPEVPLVSLERGLQADIIVVLVDHKEFASIDYQDKVLIDVVGNTKRPG